jgi:hypothetical protein
MLSWMDLANKSEEQEQADKGFLIRLSVRERFLPYRQRLYEEEQRRCTRL